VRAAIDGFLDSPDVRANPNTLRACTSVLDRVGEEIGTSRRLAEVPDDDIAGALTGLWGGAKPATWNRNRAAVGSWLAWCSDTRHWAAPALPAAAKRRRENNDYTKAVSRSRIDRLCRRRDVPLREKTLWRLLYESASRASAVLALNVEDLDLPNKQARVTVKGGDTLLTWQESNRVYLVTAVLPTPEGQRNSWDQKERPPTWSPCRLACEGSCREIARPQPAHSDHAGRLGLLEKHDSSELKHSPRTIAHKIRPS